MTDRFKAILIRKDGDKQTVEDAELTLDDLMDGDVVVAVSHSTVNYKDGLALTGRAPVVRRFPMIPGIDLAGTVESFVASRLRGRATRCCSTASVSAKPIMAATRGRPREGRLAGAAAGRLHDAPRPWPSAPPVTPRCCACWRWRMRGVTPDKGPVLVTGAAGGVGSVAIACWRSSATASSPPPAAAKKRTI